MTEATLKSSVYPVYLFSFHQAAHCDELRRHARTSDGFSDSLVMPGVIADLETALISFDGQKFTSVGMFTSANRASTGKRRGKFEYVRDFPDPVPIRPALARAKVGLKAIDATKRIHPTKIQGKLALGLDTWIRTASPANARMLDELAERRARMLASRSDPSYLKLAEQRDGVGIVLDIAGLDRADILGRAAWPENSSRRGFLEAMPPSTVKVDERRILEQDMTVFGDWKTHPPKYMATRVYTDGRVTVTLLCVDNSDVEKHTGVDLVYYFEPYDSFVMIQYKRMTQGVYTPDTRCHEQTGRMSSAFDQMYAHTSDFLHESDYRLSTNPFYLKVCEGQAPIEYSETLIEGMYFPLEHWQKILDHRRSKGDSLHISRQSAPRWLSNTEFVDIAKKGWVGSTSRAGQNWVRDLVKRYSDDDHALVLARLIKEPHTGGTGSDPKVV